MMDLKKEIYDLYVNCHSMDLSKLESKLGLIYRELGGNDGI